MRRFIMARMFEDVHARKGLHSHSQDINRFFFFSVITVKTIQKHGNIMTFFFWEGGGGEGEGIDNSS